MSVFNSTHIFFPNQENAYFGMIYLVQIYELDIKHVSIVNSSYHLSLPLSTFLYHVDTLHFRQLEFFKVLNVFQENNIIKI